MNYVQQYLALWLVATISGIAFYNIGYDIAITNRYTPTRFKCYEGIVYRDMQSHWETTGQKCLTSEQMKGIA